MSIFITGGAGFIGSHLCEYFTARGQPVTVLDNLSSGKRSNFVHPECVTLIEGDVADCALVAQHVANARAVFHLAAIASVQICTEQPELAARTNVDGTHAVFDAVAAAQHATGHRIPVVYASSAAVYGDNQNLPLSEREAPAPISPYGAHKLEAEHIAARAFNAQGVRSVGLRFFNVYGARQDPTSPYSGVISKFVERARAGQPLSIFGDGLQSRDFVYVRDVVRALTLASSSATVAALYNVGTGNATSLLQLAETISTALNCAPCPLTFHPQRAGDIRHSLADASAIATAYGITHWTPLLNGLKEMLHA